ncbi:MAG: hypothetical protein WCD56_11750 [Pseudolabrys sp.]
MTRVQGGNLSVIACYGAAIGEILHRRPQRRRDEQAEQNNKHSNAHEGTRADREITSA